MKSVSARAEELYLLSTGKHLGFEDRQLLKAIGQAVEERLAELPHLSPQQMDAINMHTIIGGGYQPISDPEAGQGNPPKEP